MEVAERLFVRNKNMWIKACSHNWKADYKPEVIELENGIILPPRLIKGTSCWSAGGVCDENFKFKGGLRRDPIAPGKGPGWGGIGESYEVSKTDLDYMNETVVFGGVLIPYFGNMLCDNFPRMWWHVQNKDSKYKLCFIVTVEQPKAWLYDFFDLMEIDRSRIMIVEKPTKFAKVIVPEEAAHSFDCYTDLWELPYNLMAENALKRVNVDELPKKIYLTKRFYKDGTVSTINEEYFENFYKSKGYAVIVPEQLPIYQQIALAANADAIAATYGTTSLFAIFAKKGIRIDILARVDHQVMQPQFLVNQTKQADYYFIDANINYLFADRCFGVVYLDKSFLWKEFVEKMFGESIAEESIDPIANLEYVKQWANFYYDNPRRLAKFSDKGSYDFFKNICVNLLGKEPDQSKYNLTNSPQQLKNTVNQLQKTADEAKKQLAEAQAQLPDKTQNISLLENEKSKLETKNKELELSLKKTAAENADLQSSNTQLDNRLKEEKVRYAELLNKHFKLAEDLTLCQTQIGEINGNIASLYTKLDAKDSDIKSLQGENKTQLQENRSLQKKNGEYAATILKNQSEIADYNSRIIHLEKSLSFRLGRGITFIPRKIRDLFRKKK